MESVIRALVVYFVLLLIFRIAGRRTLSQTSEFELVLLLIISETVQEALVDNDHSMTNAFVLIVTLVGTTIVLAFAKHRWPALGKWLDGLPVLAVHRGKPRREVLDAERVDESEVLAAGRAAHGLASFDEIEHAVVENSGDITVVPRAKPAGS